MTNATVTSAASATPANNEPAYFDIHTRGVAYINNVRYYAPKKGAKQTWMNLSMMRGEVKEDGKLEYTNFDVRAVGGEAKRVVEEMLMNEVNKVDDKGFSVNKVIATVSVGDIYIHTFEYTSGKNKGKPGVVIKGRLLKIYSAKVNGSKVYEAPKVETPDASKQVPNAPRQTVTIDAEYDEFEDGQAADFYSQQMTGTHN